MPKDRSLVRASDIGTWAFCNRAWWLANVQKAPHERPQMLDWGDQSHAAHGRLVTRSGQLQKVGLSLLGAGLILLALLLLAQGIF